MCLISVFTNASFWYCYAVFSSNCPKDASSENTETTIYAITPTYARPTQKVDLTSLCQTLTLAGNVVWVVVEDSKNRTKLVSNLLQRCPVSKNLCVILFLGQFTLSLIRVCSRAFILLIAYTTFLQVHTVNYMYSTVGIALHI